MGFAAYVLLVSLCTTVFISNGHGVTGTGEYTGKRYGGPYFSSLPMSDRAVTFNVSEGCVQAFPELVHLNETSVLLSMLDAMGKPGSGLKEYSSNWYGDFQECTAISQAHYCVSSFKANVSASLPPIPIRWGLCIPKKCTAEDAGALLFSLEEVTAPFNLPMLAPAIQTISNFMSEHEVDGSIVGFCYQTAEWSTGSIVSISLVAVLLTLLLLGTCVDWYYFADGLRPGGVSILNAEQGDLRGPLSGFGGEVVGRLNVSGTEEKQPLIPKMSPTTLYSGPRSLHRALDLLRCFSVPRKLNIILAATHKPGTIPCLHGLRVLSMFWVILGHNYMWPLITGESNAAYALTIVQRWSFQWVLNGTFSVDTFFFLSGLLVMFLTLKHLDANGGSIKWYLFYIHRFLRLTPLYMFVIMAYVYLVPFFGTGPMWSSLFGTSDPCKQYWWTNLLYINNFYPHSMGAQCIAWSWYLANDMQFFIISPLVIMAAYRYRKVGMLLTVGFLCVASIIIRGVLVAHYQFKDSAAPFAAFAAGGGGTTNTTEDSSGDVLYEKPYTRITTYAIGMGVGYILRRLPNMQQTLPRATRILLAVCGWVLVAVLLGVPLFSLYGMYSTGTGLGLPASIAYGMFSRFSWGLGLAILVINCQSGYGGYVNSFLSHPVWIPLSRLTYGAYLVHPILLFLVYLSTEHAIYFTDAFMVFGYLAAVVASYLVALICAVGLEYPLLEVESQLVGR